jgi:site-specific recombinase XerD
MMELSPSDEIHRKYVRFLRCERGLAENSILVYSPFILNFLKERTIRHRRLEELDARVVQQFLLNRSRNRSSEYVRLMSVALRSFFRFLYIHREMTLDLSVSVPTVRRWRQAEVTPFLSNEEVNKVLSATDRSIARGRRDYAILLLLARLGFRAGEVAALELGDILWRSGEIIVRGKGRLSDRLPLLKDVGQAIAQYLRKDRGNSVSRNVFLRMLAPRIGLAGPCAIGDIVRVALARAGVARSGRVGAHLFRHTLATKMIRNSASIHEISEVLRHRSQNTTQIYTKVAFESLREVAQAWPSVGAR